MKPWDFGAGAGPEILCKLNPEPPKNRLVPQYCLEISVVRYLPLPKITHNVKILWKILLFICAIIFKSTGK
jgi:hypothetical protein